MAPEVTKQEVPGDEPPTPGEQAAHVPPEQQPEVEAADPQGKPARIKAEVKPPANPESGPKVVTSEAVEKTISSFTALDQSGDRRAMNDLAQRLGKEQPALLRFAAQTVDAEGKTVGEAAVFYATLVWAMYERHLGRKAPRLLPQNLDDAKKILEGEWADVPGFADKPVHERVGPGVHRRQPVLVTKLMELIEEDVGEKALTEEAAAALFAPTQITVEAFDAAIKGTRPAQELAPIRREAPKVGRNEPCSCGSGKKFKRCHGANA